MKNLTINEKIELKGMMSKYSVWNHIKRSKRNINKFYEMIIDGSRWSEVCLETARGNTINHLLGHEGSSMSIQPMTLINRY